MNSRERMLRTIQGKQTDCIPVTPHWWGLYKFQYAGIISGYDEEEKAWSLYGKTLAEIDIRFYEDFKPDMFHLTQGKNSQRPFGQYDEYNSDPSVKQYVKQLHTELKKLESESVVNEYVDMVFPDEKAILNAGVYEHVKIIYDRFGAEVFIALHKGNPIGVVFNSEMMLGFEEALTAMLEKPKMMECLIFKCYERCLEHVKALAKTGCHAYIGSETYCAADVISPQMYEDIIFQSQKYFYDQVEKLGLIPIAYFLGDVIPILKYVKKLGIKALMVEEQKKNYNLDIVQIKNILGNEMALFGNLDSVHILKNGTVDDVRLETLRQLEAGKSGEFIMSNGCPVSFNTPAENIRVMLETVRS